jgi:hypothetical protein
MKKATAVLLVALMPSAALAQASKEHGGARIAIPISSGPLYLSAVRKAEELAETRDPQAQPKRRIGHPVLLGATIGGTGGFVLNATQCRTGESFCTGAGNALMAGIGAAIGAGIGALISR